MEKGEISCLDDFDWDYGSYYEVESWKSGDCESRFFKTKAAALKVFRKSASHPHDCIKHHHDGHTELVKTFGE